MGEPGRNRAPGATRYVSGVTESVSLGRGSVSSPRLTDHLDARGRGSEPRGERAPALEGRQVLGHAAAEPVHRQAAKDGGKGGQLGGPEAEHARRAGMPRDALVIPDGDLDERHQALPTVVALGQVEQLLEGLVGGEEVARVEDPDGRHESRGKAVVRDSCDFRRVMPRARTRGAVRLLAGPPRGRRQAAFLLPWLSIWIGTLWEAKPGGSGAV